MNNEAINQAIKVLNRMLAADSIATCQLLNYCAPCNETLADDPTIQVGGTSAQKQKKQSKLEKMLEVVDNKFEITIYTVGVLGLINGLFGVDERGFGYIAAVYDVVCPAGCHPDKILSEKCHVDDACPKCGTSLILGKLVRFERMPNSTKEES